jgi:hypothetical protein
MNKGFLPFRDSFGNFFAGEENEFRGVDAATYQSQQQDQQQTLPNPDFDPTDVEKEEGVPTPIDVYPIKIRGFFMTNSGSRKSPQAIFYDYNGFGKSSDKTEARCSINLGNNMLISEDMASITEDPFDMLGRLQEVKDMMVQYALDCENKFADTPADTNGGTQDTIEETMDSNTGDFGEQGGGNIGIPTQGGAPLGAGDLSVYCSQVPNDPACQNQGGILGGIGGGKEKNYLLIGALVIAGYFAYKNFSKKSK